MERVKTKPIPTDSGILIVGKLYKTKSPQWAMSIWTMCHPASLLLGTLKSQDISNSSPAIIASSLNAMFSSAKLSQRASEIQHAIVFLLSN